MVRVGVGVNVGVIVLVGVTVGVMVFVGVTLGVGSITSYSKSFTSQTTGLQSGQSGSNILNLSFNILKLCFISGAVNGSTYILN